MEPVNYPLATSTWDSEEYASIARVLDSGKFSMGDEVLRFEQEAAKFFDARFAVMFNSGSSANLAALTAIRLKSQIRKTERTSTPEVIVPAVSWSTTYFPVNQAGYKLVFVDIDEDTLNIDVEAAKRALTDNTVGVVAVNLLGNPAQLLSLTKFCVENELFLVEDNCESMGATLAGRYCGTFGEIGTFSTYFSHHISTMEGGFCLTDDTLIADILKSLRAHGWTRNLSPESELHVPTVDAWKQQFTFVLPGYNLRPLEMEGAIGLAQLKKLPDIIAGRRRNWRAFKQLMSEFPEFVTQSENGESSSFGFAILVHRDYRSRLFRDQLAETLGRFGIESRPIVTGNFTLQPAMSFLSYEISGELTSSQIVDDFGLFIGNHHYDISAELNTLRRGLEAYLHESGVR